MKKQIFGLAIGIVSLCGCVQVPAGRITFGDAKAYLPKDWKATTIKITVVSGTNTMTFEASGIDTHNSPEVINASTAQLQAVMEGAAKMAGDVAAAAVKASAPIP